MKLTKTLVDGCLPRASRYRLNDTLVPGLSLVVFPGGAKTYYLRHRTIDGRQVDLKLGTPVELSPDDARRIARDMLAQVRQGRDPGAERRQLRQAPTLADLADRYMATHGKAKRSGFNDEILWRLHILPALGRVRVTALTRQQVREFHTSHPKPITANRALEVLSKAMALAEDWGWRQPGPNPCDGVKANPERKRRRYLTPDELGRLRTALIEWEIAGPLSLRWRFAQLVRLLLLTGARLNEIMQARWEWIDWGRCELVVPIEAHKTGDETGEPRVITLGDRATEILLQLREHQSAKCPWLIEGSRIERHLVGYRKLWLSLVSEAQIRDLRVHDLRHTFASYTLSHGHSLGVVGQLLGHRSTQTTARYAHLVDEVARSAVRQVGDGLQV